MRTSSTVNVPRVVAALEPPGMNSNDLPLTASDFREILASALTGAVQTLRHPPPRPDPHLSDLIEPSAVHLGAVPTGRLALSLTEAAEALGVGRTTVYRLTSSG